MVKILIRKERNSLIVVMVVRKKTHWETFVTKIIDCIPTIFFYEANRKSAVNY